MRSMTYDRHVDKSIAMMYTVLVCAAYCFNPVGILTQAEEILIEESGIAAALITCKSIIAIALVCVHTPCMTESSAYCNWSRE